jgi:hypothetical protein
MITLQYLEPGPHLVEIEPGVVRAKLLAAFERLPIDCLLLGWDIPADLEDVCREVASTAGAKLYRWHPILTGDGDFYPKEEWRTRNYRGDALPGFRGLPEFTFVCPNNRETREAALDHLADLSQSGRYEGIFLDRMRFPSPAGNPVEQLTCFCEACQTAATDFGLDLASVCQLLPQTDKLPVLRELCGESARDILTTFLDFRQHTIANFIQACAAIVRSAGLEVGLDCFSPSLTRMVGQDLSALTTLADWTKVMVYGHAFGPATLPYELLHLTQWLSEDTGLNETEALAHLSEVIGFSLPTSHSTLHERGLTPENLASEIEKGKRSASGALLAGIELVEMPGVSELRDSQIEADLLALKAAGADGLAISWDLWHIPLERLELVSKVWQAG